MANIFQKIFGGSESRTGTAEFPGAFGTPESGRLARFAERGLTGGPSSILQMLRGELEQPSFGTRGPTEEALISSVADIAGGRSAQRGLGVPSFGGVAQTIAPALQNLRQTRVSNLAQALGQETAGRGVDLQGLLQLIQLAQPRLRGESQTTKTGGIIPGLSALSEAGGLRSILAGAI